MALGLRRATPDSAADAVARFQDYFERAGSQHFDVEEAVLLPALPEQGEWKALCARVRDEHRAMRAAGARVLAAERDVPVEEVRELGQALDAHVRFEERKLFPFLEERLTATELTELGRLLQAPTDPRPGHPGVG